MILNDGLGKAAIDLLTAASTLVALAAFIASVIKNWSDKEDRKQEVLLEQCKRTLEWAYTALMPEEGQRPEADRLNWLTAARHILAYQDIRKSIDRMPYSRIIEDHEEFWRHRFYLALSDATMSHYTYWSAADPILINIDPRSALVVVDFAGWPPDKSDPTELPPEKEAALRSRNGLKGNAGRGLRQYLDIIEERNRRRG